MISIEQLKAQYRIEPWQRKICTQNTYVKMNSTASVDAPFSLFPFRIFRNREKHLRLVLAYPWVDGEKVMGVFTCRTPLP